MRADSLRRRIEHAVLVETTSGAVRVHALEALRAAGEPQPDDRADRLVEFLIGFVRAAPAVLEALYDAAERSRVREAVAPMLESATAYLQHEEDLIPDDLGLLGVVDDAAVVLGLLHLASAAVDARRGKGLFDFDLAPPIRAVRRILGEPTGSLLAAEIEHASEIPAVRSGIADLARVPRPPAVALPDPLASVLARLGDPPALALAERATGRNRFP